MTFRRKSFLPNDQLPFVQSFKQKTAQMIPLRQGKKLRLFESISRIPMTLPAQGKKGIDSKWKWWFHYDKLGIGWIYFWVKEMPYSLLVIWNNRRMTLNVDPILPMDLLTSGLKIKNCQSFQRSNSVLIGISLGIHFATMDNGRILTCIISDIGMIYSLMGYAVVLSHPLASPSWLSLSTGAQTYCTPATQ